MPHAVIVGAKTLPALGPEPLGHDGKTIHKVMDVAEADWGWLLRSLIVVNGESTRFFTRVDRRDDGLVVRLDDHVSVERTLLVFAHLGLIARRVLDANPASKLGATNLQEHIPTGVAT